MKGIRQKRGKFQVVTSAKVNGKRVQPTRTFDSYDKAVRFKLDFDRQFGRTIVPERVRTFRELAGDFLSIWCADGRDGAGLSAATVDIYRRALDYVMPILGEMCIDRIGTQHIQQAYNRLRSVGGVKGQPLAATTLHTIHASLHKFFEVMCDWHKITSNPTRKARLPKLGKHMARAPSMAQVGQLLTTVNQSPYLEIIQLALRCGLRRGELLGLRWCDVDLEKKTLEVVQVCVAVQHEYFLRMKPKTQSSRRIIGLDAGSVDIIQGWRVQLAEQVLKLGLARSGADLVFPDIRAGTAVPRSPDVVSAIVSRFCKRAGIPSGFTGLHALRHRYGTSLRHLPPKLLSASMGHSRIEITQNFYIGADDDEGRQEVAAAVDAAFGPAVRKRRPLVY
jgi:integrase